MTPCPAVNPATGERCSLPAGHLEEDPPRAHLPLPAQAAQEPPEPPAGAPPDPMAARVRATRGRIDHRRLDKADAAIANGRRGANADRVPDGTYPTPPPKELVCRYVGHEDGADCSGEAKLYLGGVYCHFHSPGVTRLRRQARTAAPATTSTQPSPTLSEQEEAA